MKDQTEAEWLRNAAQVGHRMPLETTPILPSSVYAAYVVRPSHLIVPPTSQRSARHLNAVTRGGGHLTAEALDAAAIQDGKTPRERIAIQISAREGGRLTPGDLSAVAPDPRGPAMTGFTSLLRDQRKITVAELDVQSEAGGLSTKQQIAVKLARLWAGKLI